jgi:hypothetical protein
VQIQELLDWNSQQKGIWRIRYFCTDKRVEGC